MTLIIGCILKDSGCATHGVVNDGIQIKNLDTVFGGINVRENAKAGNISSD